MHTDAKSILVMGVSGSGKSHIGRQVAAAIDATFIDADDYHSAANVAKMARGEPLTDDDRAAWLQVLADLYRRYRTAGQSLVIGCSALKRRYRDRLRQGAPDLQILYLHGSRNLLLQRLDNRDDHFFAGAHMLDSQLATLEVPDETEAFRCNVRSPPREIVEAFTARLRST
ncbi:gluconokinase [Halomonas nitroreducens]|uniref:Gluconokinase n=1 Tax=Halomonas nitroreducens TaxID=447425 RepID=A0A431V1Y7_9GAMM|nr:gluconokinase [Halomonas nitroreducens]RTR02429.1 gluconokinase [Halomonas nitroreducens]